MSENEKIKVLYVAGWGRSGTTLMDNILGQLEGFFSAGEVRYIWERSLLENWKCGCGKSFSYCDVWQEIVQDAFSGENRIEPDVVNQMTYRYTRTLRTLRLLLGGGRWNATGLSEYLAITERLYLSIARRTGSRVIIDSSKFPVYGAMLNLIPSLDVYIVHVVRDPRAVAFSWMTPKLTTDLQEPAYLAKINPVTSALWWTGWNLAINYIGHLRPDKYLRLKYEKFVSSPRSSIDEVLGFLGETNISVPFKNEFTVMLSANHTISGNPNRFKHGMIKITPDVRWLSDMHPFHRFLVTFLTLPFLSLFGYY